MKHVNLGKKRPTAWPVVIGAIALALVVWGVTTLLAPPPVAAPAEVATAAVDTHPPGAIPIPPSRMMSGRTRSVRDMAPVDESDIGADVRAEGIVVATGNDAFWLRDGSQVIRVDSPRRVRKGDTIVVEGRLAEANPDVTRRIAREVIAQDTSGPGWTVVEQVKLVETSPARPDTARTAEDSG